MSEITYVKLLEANNIIQNFSDEFYWLCTTRTVQGSKLFPVSPYILFSYLNTFYRLPSLLRKIEEVMPAEEIADRSRNMGIKLQNSHMGNAMPSFYLLGREYLLTLGFLRPQDAVEDVLYVMDFWKRYQLSWHRNDGHITNKEFGHRGQFLPDRRLEIFEADMYECEQGDDLQTAAHEFLATVSQYGFLVSCESRISLTNSGPYRLKDGREMIVRDFMDLGECALPWLDDVANGVPYNNLTVPIAVKDCHFGIIDEWGSFESEPELTAEKLTGIGLYTSDILSEGFVPVGMDSREKLIETFHTLSESIKDATNKLWMRMAGWTRDQMLDAGALVYSAVAKDLAHVAGVYDVEDWMTIDPRAERFRPLFTDEYSNAVLSELVGLLSLPNQQYSHFTMMQHSDAPTRMMTPIPYSILAGDDYVATSGPPQPGLSNLDPKIDRYRTTRGILSLKEYNKLARKNKPEICSDKYRFLCDTWVKYNAHTELANELYRVEQKNSRNLKGLGCRPRAESDA